MIDDIGSPLPTSKMLRVSAPALDEMDADQRAAFDRIAASPYGPHGPRMVLLHDASITAGWAALGAALAATELHRRWREMTVLIVAASWQADFQWQAHVGAARAAGIDDAALEAIRRNERPVLEDAGDAAVAAYVRALSVDRVIDDEVYATARALLGDKRLVQLTALAGHYTNVAMTLVAHQVPLADNAPSPFKFA